MNIVFIASCNFPYGEAYSSRALHLIKLLIDSGNKVHLIADYNNSGQIINIKNFSFEILLKKNESKAHADRICITHLMNYVDNNKVDLVITNANSKRFKRISEYCKTNNIPLVVENCEWYDKSNFPKGEKDPDYLRNQEMINKDFKGASGFISISRLLDTHNKQLGKPSIRIPTILDFEDIPFNLSNKNEKIKIVYTGRAGKSKELFEPILKALTSKQKLYRNIEFSIYGPRKVEVLRNINYNIFLYIKSIRHIKIYGYVQQERMRNIISNADYQIFIRPDRKSSHAGFPTKLAESMSVGTPVITNNTGDIGLYAVNKENGYLLNVASKENLEDILKYILSLNSRERDRVRDNARSKAESSFDYRVYLDEIKAFLSKVIVEFENDSLKAKRSRDDT